ncbi:hypothetical protein AMJ80_02995 [bacterium SM23_31]|nr:MAG: hypothetical protein AMJ80_02995 [bacterium SM23_31]
MIYILAIIIDLVFAIWVSIGSVWYIYFINFVLLFIASSMINTSYIQGLTRGVSYFYLFKLNSTARAFMINIPTIIIFIIAYVILSFVFFVTLRFILFFIACILISTIVAFIDNRFQFALEKSKMCEKLKQTIRNR